VKVAVVSCAPVVERDGGNEFAVQSRIQEGNTMPLVSCLVCSTQISSKAKVCPRCGDMEPPEPRGRLSSPLAVVASCSVAAFTYSTVDAAPPLAPGLWILVAWSYSLAIALLLWAIGPRRKVSYIGNPTLSMLAGTSGTAITALALVFGFVPSKDQQPKVNTEHQLQAIIESQERLLVEMKQLLTQDACAANPSAMQHGCAPVRSDLPISKK
jgi:hypothetical protein